MLRATLPLLLLLSGATSLFAQTREQKVRADKEKITSEGFWIYNDLPKAFAEARRSGKPILVVLRCIPCEECVKLDDEIVDQDPIVKPLLKQFVCIRQVSTNGLDLKLFQYDYDQSFAAFMLNADGTIYGRFGTRSSRSDWVGDVSIQGLAEALLGALQLHKNFSNVKASLQPKTGPAPKFDRPELYPSLKGKYAAQLDYAGQVVKSCIHCHQIGDAQRDLIRQTKKPLPDEVVFPYPHPKSQGLILDPKQKATVLKVDPGSTAEAAGFRDGDKLLSLAGQPLLSIADVQWVLHNTSPQGGKIAYQLERKGQIMTGEWTLAEGWRRTDNISWRVSSWGMRRMATGGILLDNLSAENRPSSILPGQMALLAKHVGEFGPHAAAKTAGVRREDVIIRWDGRNDLLRETDVLAYGLTQKKPGDKIPVQVLRGGKVLNFMIPMQD